MITTPTSSVQSFNLSACYLFIVMEIHFLCLSLVFASVINMHADLAEIMYSLTVMSQVTSYPSLSSNTFLRSCPPKKKHCHAHSWPWEFEKPVNCLTCTTFMWELSQCVCPREDICSRLFRCAFLHICVFSKKMNLLTNTWHGYMEWFECNKICLHVRVTFFFFHWNVYTVGKYRFIVSSIVCTRPLVGCVAQIDCVGVSL